MPFEYGIAQALGKRHAMMAHSDVLDSVKIRIDPSTAVFDYEDLTFREKIEGVVQHCQTRWLSNREVGFFINVED